VLGIRNILVRFWIWIPGSGGPKTWGSCGSGSGYGSDSVPDPDPQHWLKPWLLAWLQAWLEASSSLGLVLLLTLDLPLLVLQMENGSSLSIKKM
jgi:hypothetical protein